jgi:hypothetical protein
MSGLRPSWPHDNKFHNSLLRRFRFKSSAERGNSHERLMRSPLSGSMQVISSRYCGLFCKS